MGWNHEQALMSLSRKQVDLALPVVETERDTAKARIEEDVKVKVMTSFQAVKIP